MHFGPVIPVTAMAGRIGVIMIGVVALGISATSPDDRARV